MKKTKWLMVMIFAAITFIFAACGKSIVADYPDEAVFEAALVNGEDLTGKTVDVVVQELQTQSAYGYNIWAGEHLNFVSENNPGVKAGDVITVKVTEVKSVYGSWIIYYKKLGVKSQTSTPTAKVSAVGTYIGENGSIINIHNDGTATYFWYGWSDLEEGNKWTSTNTEVDIYLDKLECHITGKLVSKGKEMTFTSDSEEWDDECFTKIDETDKSISRDDYLQLLMDNGDIYASSVTPSFKAFMDEYEEIMNAYIDFMVAYEKADDITTMAVEYVKIMTKFAEATERMDSYDPNTLTGADAVYYFTVMGRIVQKMEKSGILGY